MQRPSKAPQTPPPTARLLVNVYNLSGEKLITFSRATNRSNVSLEGQNKWEELSIGLTAKEAVQVEVICENASNISVFFDDLSVKVQAVPTVLVVQENHYYPFGLGMKGLDWVLPSGKEDKYQFNRIEKNTDFDLNTLDAFHRAGDPQIGRWWQIDPKPTYGESPYTMMGNNPIKYADPLGDTVRFQGDKQSIIALGIVIDFLSSVSKDFKDLYEKLEKSSNMHRIYLKPNYADGTQARADYLQKTKDRHANKQIGVSELTLRNNRSSNAVLSNSLTNSMHGKSYDGNDTNGTGTGSITYFGLSYAQANGDFFPRMVSGAGMMHYLATIAHEFYHVRRIDKGNAGSKGIATDREEDDAVDFQNVVTRDINSFLRLITFPVQIPYRSGYGGAQPVNPNTIGSSLIHIK